MSSSVWKGRSSRPLRSTTSRERASRRRWALARPVQRHEPAGAGEHEAAGGEREKAAAAHQRPAVTSVWAVAVRAARSGRYMSSMVAGGTR